MLIDLIVNNKFSEEAELTCRSNKLGCAKILRDKKYDCLGITIDYSTRGAFQVSMTDCINTMKEDFLFETDKTLKP